ncbi:hypothetical protein C4D60_Mb01t21360 [Musa balbisiana]|uniref:Uncharacterized protein n=1 Tax=Musa balbisiana TaxID=52838 RepID=A0A4S8JQ35_MUSBA|nr:hypothetical protein C4D60_Mb01t21360 [Musa balbisiana]
MSSVGMGMGMRHTLKTKAMMCLRQQLSPAVPIVESSGSRRRKRDPRLPSSARPLASTGYSRSVPTHPHLSSSCPAAGPTRPAHLARCTCRAVGPVGESKAKLNLIRRNVRKGWYRGERKPKEGGRAGVRRRERERKERAGLGGRRERREESRGQKRRDSSVFRTWILGFRFLSGATAAAAEKKGHITCFFSSYSWFDDLNSSMVEGIGH